MHHTLTLETHGQGLYEFTEAVVAYVANQAQETGKGAGLCNIFVQHTSCSLIIQENADPDVQVDLKSFFARLVPPTSEPSMGWITHTLEGPDDMPAHIKAALTQSNLMVPVSKGRLMLGTWQGLYLFEHRDKPHKRRVVLSLI